MNNFNMVNHWYQMWRERIYIASERAAMGLDHEHACAQAVISNMNYVCYLAQEMAGIIR